MGVIGTCSCITSNRSLLAHPLTVGVEVPQSQTLEDTMKSFWELEAFGIPTADPTLYDEFCDKIKFREGRYEVALPWKTTTSQLPNHYSLSLRRLKGLLEQLKNKKTLLVEYDSVIKTQLCQGIVEPVEDATGVDVAGVHYLPHHAVRHDKQTTKVRVVYNASAWSNGPSLNDCLHSGPKFDQKILDILLRFRSHRVAVTADIEKAFLMISMSPDDCEFLRFLWVDNPLKKNPEITAYRFTRVVFAVTSSPFLLNATVRYHLESHADDDPDLVQKLLRSMYVDDVVTGAQSDERAYQLYTGAKELLKTAGFNLRKFQLEPAPVQD